MDRQRNIRLPEADFTLVQARVPSCFLARLPDGVREDDESCALLDIVVERGRIGALRPGGTAGEGTPPRIDIRGRQVWATLIDMHAHLDKGQAIPRVRPDGTLEGGLRLTAEDRKHWTAEDIRLRMNFGVRCAFAHGVSAIRTHLDSHEGLADRTWAVFREVQSEWRGRVALQPVGMVPLAAFRGSWGEQLADIVAEHGGVLGGVTDGLGGYEGAIGNVLDDLLDRLLRVAAERRLDVDLHVDQTDDPRVFALPRIAH